MIPYSSANASEYVLGLSLIVATLAPMVNCVQLFPQIYRTWSTSRVKDLSFYAILLMLTTNVLWLSHGYFIQDTSLIVAGIISMCATTTLAILYTMYR